MLEAREITKSFGSVRALDRVSIAFQPGEVHAVLGENGAGKSTLMAVLAGYVEPDRGEVVKDGKLLPLGRPFECRRLGIAMIHQHFTLVPDFTVQENLALAKLESLAAPLHADRLAARAFEIARELEWEVDPEAKVRTLPVGVQQRVEILKNLATDADVVIFDEPTAVLSPEEVGDLLRVIRSLAQRGKCVILIAHKLVEVMAVADRVSVLRRGRLVGTTRAAETTTSQLAEWMVGELPEALTKSGHATGAPAFRAEDVVVKGDRGEEAVRGVSFDVAAGEIFGIGGVDGNGQVELAEALAGVRELASGRCELIPAGGEVAYVPQDRQQDGLALGMSIQDNLLVGGYDRADLRRGPLLAPSRIRAWARSLIDRFQIKVGSPSDPVASLSGGNQQKVVVSRALERKPKLLVAVNPTRGLDLKAERYVHQKIEEARDAGAAVVLFSTDLDELAALADRTVFLSRGVFVAAEDASSLVGGAH